MSVPAQPVAVLRRSPAAEPGDEPNRDTIAVICTSTYVRPRKQVAGNVSVGAFVRTTGGPKPCRCAPSAAGSRRMTALSGTHRPRVSHLPDGAGRTNPTVTASDALDMAPDERVPEGRQGGPDDRSRPRTAHSTPDLRRVGVAVGAMTLAVALVVTLPSFGRPVRRPRPRPPVRNLIVTGTNGGGINYTGIPYPAPGNDLVVTGTNGGGINCTGIPYPVAQPAPKPLPGLHGNAPRRAASTSARRSTRHGSTCLPGELCPLRSPQLGPRRASRCPQRHELRRLRGTERGRRGEHREPEGHGRGDRRA